MKKRLAILFGFLCLLIGSANAQDGTNNPKNVMIQPTDSVLEKPRSIIGTDAPTVTLSGSILTFDFSSSTVAQIVVCSQSSHQIVFSDSYASTTQVVIDLEDEGIGEGSYLLWLYAFDEWWIGEFEIIE